MCGIAGVMMCNGRRLDPAVLDLLEAAIDHRGPDGSGRHLDGPVGLVSTRLAIIDLETGDQPIGEPRGAVLVANGEIYNDLELRAQLRDAPFRTKSDCESPLHVYRRKGLNFAEDLRGMYGLAIYDADESRMVLARDPFGIKPLYYVESATHFAFASELQALIVAGLAGCQIRPQARAELLQLKFTTGSETIFSQIRRVLPGETIVVVDGRVVERRRRNAIPRQGPIKKDYRQALRQLDEVLSGSVALHLRSDVPYGLFLSGGIDSSALLALMARFSSKPVVALTVGFPGSRAADEREAALRVARSLGAEHHLVEMTERNFWAIAPRVAAAVDDPTTDAATLPTFALGEAARGRLKVVLSGEGADEMFAGYSRYRRVRWLGGLLARRARTRGEFDGLANMNGALSGWRDGLRQTEDREGCAERSPLQTMQAVDCAEWLPNDLLVKLDRCLMAHGVEGRTPYLDPIVAQFAFCLPDDMKVTAKLGKRLLRDWLSSHVPAAEAFVKKTGFNPPVGEWIAARKGSIAALVSSQPGVAEIATKDEVRRVFSDPEKNSQAAWSLLFYALWHSHHIMGIADDGNVSEILSAAA